MQKYLNMLGKLIQKVFVLFIVLMGKTQRDQGLILSLLSWFLLLDLALRISGVCIFSCMLPWVFDALYIIPPLILLEVHYLYAATLWSLFNFNCYYLYGNHLLCSCIFPQLFCSNGSWRSVWNIEFKDDQQVMELKGKFQVLSFLLLCRSHHSCINLLTFK